MGQSYPLDRVIRTAAAGAAFDPAYQRLVGVDPAKGTVVARRLFPWIDWSDARYYVVSNRSILGNEGRLEIGGFPLADIQHPLDLSATLLVGCPPGNEERVALALSDPAFAPDAVLERHVAQALQELARDGAAVFARRFVSERTAVEAELARAVAVATGLAVRVTLAVKGWPPELVTVEDRHLALRASDWDEELEVALKADLEADEATAEAVLHRGRVAELEPLVKEEVRRHFRRSVPLRSFNVAGVGEAKQALIAHLDGVLRPFGRRVGALILTPRDDGHRSDAVIAEIAIHCPVRQYPRDIEIRTHVLLRVVDPVRYRESGSRDLREWLNDVLPKLVQHLLFSARYTDLLVRFGEWEEKIRHALSAAAARIGCDVSQFTVADLPETVYKQPFDVRIERAYKTRLHDVEVTLEAVVRARIPNLESIATLLSNQSDLPRAMSDAIAGTIAHHLEGLSPERVYMRFGFTDPERHRDEPQPVEAELEERVRQRLAGDEFGAEVLGVVIKIVATDLIERFRALQKAMPRFQVTVRSLDGTDVSFVGELRVIGVHRKNGWQRFRVFTGGVEEVTSRVVEGIVEALHTLSGTDLRYRDEDGRRALEDLAARAVLDSAADQFGLVVSLTGFRIDLTGEIVLPKDSGLVRTAEELRQALSRALADGDMEHAAVLDLRLAEVVRRIDLAVGRRSNGPGTGVLAPRAARETLPDGAEPLSVGAGTAPTAEEANP